MQTIINDKHDEEIIFYSNIRLFSKYDYMKSIIYNYSYVGMLVV